MSCAIFCSHFAVDRGNEFVALKAMDKKLLYSIVKFWVFPINLVCVILLFETKYLQIHLISLAGRQKLGQAYCPLLADLFSIYLFSLAGCRRETSRPDFDPNLGHFCSFSA